MPFWRGERTACGMFVPAGGHGHGYVQRIYPTIVTG